MPDQAIQYCQERERETTHEPDHGEWQTWDHTDSQDNRTGWLELFISRALLSSPLDNKDLPDIGLQFSVHVTPSFLL